MYQKVLLKKTSTAAEAEKIIDPDWKHLAYEMAVKICEADGITSPKEKEFLTRLASELGMEQAEATEIITQGDEMAAAQTDELPTSMLPVLPGEPPSIDNKKPEVDSVILKYSIINGALELLPETLSTMAIIPLQMKLVNSVGKHYGISLDKRQLVEFLGAAGIGATSQIVEGFAQKMIGGFAGSLGKKFLGKTAGSFTKKAASQITSSAFSFASTWAIGTLANRYYANGRSWSGINPKTTFHLLREQAEPLHQKYLPEIQQQASSLNYSKVLSMIRA